MIVLEDLGATEKEVHRCKFCGLTTPDDPSDQSPPVNTCNHENPEALVTDKSGASKMTDLISREAAAGKAKHAAQVYGEREAASTGKEARDWQSMKLAALDIETALRVLPAQEPAVKVKPLKWQSGQFAWGRSECGLYRTEQSRASDKFCVFWGMWPLRDEGGATVWHDTIEQAREAAQRDHEKRIAAYLEHSAGDTA